MTLPPALGRHYGRCVSSAAQTPHRCEAGTQRPPTLRLVSERVDRHRPITAIALAGLSVGALLAIAGLPPVDLAGPLSLGGVVCPLCGGTRAVYYVMLGQWGTAWTYNPLGILLVTGAAGMLVRHLVGTISRQWLNLRVRWHRAAVTCLIAVLAAGTAALWVNQQLHAELLLTG